MWKRLKKSKTAWALVGGILVTLGMAISGQMEWGEAGKLLFEEVVGLFLRDGIAKIS